ncbi:FAST kinase domain-containing protein 5, mitochondrial [Pectinophora gossypiella]|uniref:FAST kinase domain-containing protein 5, mitochondrial n=1 Tax=Pectinophora gossypiella TaxID=13191 RepID=UPI00214ECE0F|nr:FAST kinase domain-containing protein 5, mitochondrial [Pectinophora gossypiella]
MFSASKIMRRLLYKKCGAQEVLFTSVNKVQIPHKCFHNNVNLCVKMFVEHENKYAYKIMENKGYTISLNIQDKKSTLSKERFEDLMKENWSTYQPKQLFEVFSTLGCYCSEQNICISNKIFDNFIDNLTDNIKNASDNDLVTLFYSLARWPETESIRTRNYIEVWAALDDACLNRLKDWSYDEMLSFLSLFFMLNVTRASEFSQKCVQRLVNKEKHLAPGQLVQTLFFIGIVRKQPFDMHNIELRMQKCLQDLSLDDIAIMSMGFFKSKTPIRSMELVGRIIDRIIDNSNNINEISLASLLKVIRYSVKINTDDKIYRLLDTLQHEVHRLSVMCIVHLALVGTSTLTLHEDCLTKIAHTMINLLPSARLKDLERLVLTYGTLNFKPPEKDNLCFFEKIIDELQSPNRQEEVTKYGRSFACCLGFLGLLGIYPLDLMKKVLNPEFLLHTYGKHCFSYGREVLTIHNTSLIFHPDTEINRLSDKVATILAKKYTDYVPDENYKKQYNVTEKMFLDVYNVLKEDRGGSEYIKGDHILTHHQRGDIILCNSHSGTPLPVNEKIRDKDFGLIRTPPDDNRWIVLVIAGRNTVIQGSGTPSGHVLSKIRELNALGFYSTVVPWSAYIQLQTKEEKTTYLNNLIKEALK